MDGQLRVGIVGLSASGGWAAAAHVPALRKLPEFRLAGVSGSTPEAARAAAEKFDVDLAFDDAAAMAASDDIDVVVVTVKVPHHKQSLLPALAAEKIVLCEWPLAVDVDEAEELAAMATAPAFVGLQARSAPAANYLRDLIADGYVGTVLSTSVIGSGVVWGAQVEPRNAYILDRNTGATMLTIPFGHAVDAITMVLGEFSDVNATLATRRSSVTEVGSGRVLPMTAADQVAVTGELVGGAVASIHYRGGVSRATNFSWEINGSEGDLLITAESGQIQMSEMTIRGAQGDDKRLEVLPVPAKYAGVEAELAQSAPHAYNVACAYRQIARDLRDGTAEAPTFEHAVQRHRLLERIEQSARHA